MLLGARGEVPRVLLGELDETRAGRRDSRPARRPRAAHTGRGKQPVDFLLQHPLTRAAACPAGRRLPASIRSCLTPRPTRCSASSQAVSSRVRALTRPTFLTANLLDLLARQPLTEEGRAMANDRGLLPKARREDLTEELRGRLDPWDPNAYEEDDPFLTTAPRPGPPSAPLGVVRYAFCAGL